MNGSYPCNTPSILSFSVDIRRGKMGEDRIVDAHMLRLLYNRYLQWRFVNARADATFMVQKLNAEVGFCCLWYAFCSFLVVWPLCFVLFSCFVNAYVITVFVIVLASLIPVNLQYNVIFISAEAMFYIL